MCERARVCACKFVHLYESAAAERTQEGGKCRAYIGALIHKGIPVFKQLHLGKKLDRLLPTHTERERARMQSTSLCFAQAYLIFIHIEEGAQQFGQRVAAVIVCGRYRCSLRPCHYWRHPHAEEHHEHALRLPRCPALHETFERAA